MRDQPPPSHEHGVDPRSFVWGVIWRSVAWGLPTGALLGAIYGFCLNLQVVTSGVALVSGNGVVVASMVAGGIVGSLGGFVLALVAGFTIALVPTPPPESPQQFALVSAHGSPRRRRIRRCCGMPAIIAGPNNCRNHNYFLLDRPGCGGRQRRVCSRASRRAMVLGRCARFEFRRLTSCG